ncbi:hypothetical protein [Dankookia sp. P2]|uniref:hypothetical protein n=1 Tax=Dankookia sp. P2 TaxID=3423955 RepID=UPI003D666A9E
MHRMHRIAATLIFAAALPGLARAEGEGHGDPQREARIEQLIQDAIQGDIAAERQEQARIDRLVRQALDRAGSAQGPGAGGPSGLLAQGSAAAPRR